MSSWNPDDLMRRAEPRLVDAQARGDEMLARLATEIWRLGRRVERLANNAQELEAVGDSCRRMKDTLLEFGVDVRDHDNEPFADGSPLEVLHSRGGDPPYVVIETIRPTVVAGGRHLQHGQVIIGVAGATSD